MGVKRYEKMGTHGWVASAGGVTTAVVVVQHAPRAFSQHGFPDEVIAVAVRHAVRYRLSYADVVAWFAERGLVVDRRLDVPVGAVLPPAISTSRPYP